MSFGAPGALWGLLALGILVLLSLWRLRPQRVLVASVQLWRKVPSRVPPVRALRGPRFTASFWAQGMAIVCWVFALGAPYVEHEVQRPRTVGIVIDHSARMLTRMAAARAAYEQVRASLSPTDRVETYTFPPVQRREPTWQVAHVASDPTLALELARQGADVTFFIGDRRVDAPVEQILVGGASRNVGAIDVNIDEGKLTVRILEGSTERVIVCEPQPEVRVAQDEFWLDDVVYVDRQAAPIEVALEGQVPAPLRRAFERLPRVRLVSGVQPALVVRMGEGARTGDPSAQVIIRSPGRHGFTPRAVVPTQDPQYAPLFRSVDPSELRLTLVAEVEGGVPLLFADGRPIAALQDHELVMGVELLEEGWPTLPSFPIFWANVVEFLVGSADEWVIRTTREPVVLQGGRTVFASRVGAQEVAGETVHANLLDRRASDLRGEARAFDPSRLPRNAIERDRRDLSVWFVVAALIFVVIAWILERKVSECRGLG